jgi:hypothetical protein
VSDLLLHRRNRRDRYERPLCVAANGGPWRAVRRDGRNLRLQACLSGHTLEEVIMDGIIYLVGLIVIIMFILSFFGLR